MKQSLFNRHYDVAPEMLIDFLQQALASLPTVTSYRLDDSGDRIAFTTSFTLTSWGDNMVAEVRSAGAEGSLLSVSGEPRMGVLSTPWGEEIHAATIESQLLGALEPSIELARTNPIMMLQADHRRVEVLFARIQGAEGGAREELVEELLLALRVHMELEESHVYPLLADEVDADLAEEAEVEHQLARDGVERLSELSPHEPGFDAALAMVMAGIEHHVQEEESEAFPRLSSQLGPDRLAALARELTAARRDLLSEAQSSSDDDTDARRTRDEKSTDARRTRDDDDDQDSTARRTRDDARRTRDDDDDEDTRARRSRDDDTDARRTEDDDDQDTRARRTRDDADDDDEDTKARRTRNDDATEALRARDADDDAKSRRTSDDDGKSRRRGDEETTSRRNSDDADDAKSSRTKDERATAPRAARPKRQPDRARTPRRKTTKVDPDETTKADLVQRAKKAGVSGYSHMSKAELADAIAKAK